MSKYYKIEGLPGFEGLVAFTECDEDIFYTTGALPKFLYIDAISQPLSILGDREVRFPLPKKAMLINTEYLTETDYRPKEFAIDNPFGKYHYDGSYTKDDVNVIYQMYDNALAVTIRENRKDGTSKTIYAQNFFETRVKALDAIEDVLRNTGDIEDLVFKLKEIK